MEIIRFARIGHMLDACIRNALRLPVSMYIYNVHIWTFDTHASGEIAANAMFD